MSMSNSWWKPPTPSKNLKSTTATNNLGAGIYGAPKISSGATGGLGSGIFGAPKVTGTPAPAGATPSGRPPGVGGGGGGMDMSTPPPVQERGPVQWEDSAYNSQIAAIQRALQDYETGAVTRGERYGQDFATGLQRMGYRPAEGFQAMPNVLEMINQPQARGMSADGAEGANAVALPKISGAFDIEGEYDPYSAAARGTRSTRDEFAGRGTLRSSDFAKTFGDFQNRLNQQLEAMETGRTRFGQDLATEVAQQRTQAQERQEAARQAALLRAATREAGIF